MRGGEAAWAAWAAWAGWAAAWAAWTAAWTRGDDGRCTAAAMPGMRANADDAKKQLKTLTRTDFLIQFVWQPPRGPRRPRPRGARPRSTKKLRRGRGRRREEQGGRRAIPEDAEADREDLARRSPSEVESAIVKARRPPPAGRGRPGPRPPPAGAAGRRRRRPAPPAGEPPRPRPAAASAGPDSPSGRRGRGPRRPARSNVAPADRPRPSAAPRA